MMPLYITKPKRVLGREAITRAKAESQIYDSGSSKNTKYLQEIKMNSIPSKRNTLILMNKRNNN